VAVLYFESGTRDSSELYLADGLTEEIINRLSGIERLTVRSRYQVRRYRGTAMEDPAAVGRTLGVAYIVSGSVRRTAGRLRVNAELIRAAGGVQVWGQQFDQASADVFQIQEAVAREVATGIVGRLLPAERQTLATRPTSSAAAYDAFLRGNFSMARRDSAGIRRAVEEFERALRADPTYTDALSRIALAYGIAAGNGFSIGVPQDSMVARAVRNADEAVRRAPNSSEAWLAMGLSRLAASPRRSEGVIEALERAITLDPANAEAHHLLGFNLALRGLDSLGIAQDRMALAIEPARPVTIMHLAQFAAKFGHYAEARRWADSALVFDPDFWSARALRTFLLLVAGDTAGARAEVARWRGIQPLRDVAPFAERVLAPHGADSASVQAWRASIRAAIPAEVPVSIGLGVSTLAMVASGDPEIVLAVQEAVRPRGAFLHYFLTWAAFDPLRSDARFQRLFQETTP
jgi:adenylate cyclase